MGRQSPHSFERRCCPWRGCLWWASGFCTHEPWWTQLDHCNWTCRRKCMSDLRLHKSIRPKLPRFIMPDICSAPCRAGATSCQTHSPTSSSTHPIVVWPSVGICIMAKSPCEHFFKRIWWHWTARTAHLFSFSIHESCPQRLRWWLDIEWSAEESCQDLVHFADASQTWGSCRSLKGAW